MSVAQEDGEAVVRVRDTRIGFSPTVLPHVFDLLVEGREQQGGLEIGLSLVRSLVQLHGGSVTASSDYLHKGSEFVARLPLAEETDQENRGVRVAANDQRNGLPVERAGCD